MASLQTYAAAIWACRTCPKWTNALLASMLLMICGVLGFVMLESRSSQFAQASVEASNISSLISQDVSRNLELFDLSITGALDAIRDPAIMQADKRLRQLILFDRAATAPYLGLITIIDGKGNVIADSRSAQPLMINYADRDYFRIHENQADYGLYVSRPLIARSNGDRIIALSRRINNPDGSFGGVVAGTVRLDYFHKLFEGLKVGAKGSITLFRSDGTLLMREPYNEAQIGLKLDPPKLFDLASRASDGEYEAASAIDGVGRLYHFHRLAGLPLVQNVGLAIDDIYARWWQRTLIVSLVVALCCLVITVLSLLLGRELRLRVVAEQALRDLAERDGLTALANRRCFDRVLVAEWARAQRERQWLALLLIDADQFKLFNDTLGHPAGDAALIQLARCLETGAQRPADLVARYGGEEFAILLPGTDGVGAMVVAERLRATVESLNISHPASMHRRFTISIGVASVVPVGDRTAAPLIEEADAALYVSKNGGRNQANWKSPPTTLIFVS